MRRRSAKKSSERLTKGRGFRAAVISEDIAASLGATIGVVASTTAEWQYVRQSRWIEMTRIYA